MAWNQPGTNAKRRRPATGGASFDPSHASVPAIQLHRHRCQLRIRPARARAEHVDRLAVRDLRQLAPAVRALEAQNRHAARLRAGVHGVRCEGHRHDAAIIHDRGKVTAGIAGQEADVRDLGDGAELLLPPPHAAKVSVAAIKKAPRNLSRLVPSIPRGRVIGIFASVEGRKMPEIFRELGICTVRKSSTARTMQGRSKRKLQRSTASRAASPRLLFPMTAMRPSVVTAKAL